MRYILLLPLSAEKVKESSLDVNLHAFAVLLTR